MLTDQEKYNIFAARNDRYSGLFYMAVSSTGIFCRPGCPARLPKQQNCSFFDRAEDAVQAGFRPCKRCHPLKLPGEASDLIKKLIDMVESDPDRKWGEKDLVKVGIDPSTARRQFKSRFGMTFSAYVKGRNLVRARQDIVKGDSVINAQLNAGFDSPSGFRSAYNNVFGTAPKNEGADPLIVEWLDTSLGPMIIVCDDTHLYLSEFTVRKNLKGQFEKLSKHYQRPILPGTNHLTDEVCRQIKAYFTGQLQQFDLPLFTTGTDFQKRVWAALIDIPFGSTCSYAELAVAVGNEKAVRAVAGSNAKNGLAIIIPCHRVINKGGKLGGYAGGLDKKQWLLDHEVSVVKSS